MATFTGTTGTLSANGSTPEIRGNGTLSQCDFRGDFGGGFIDLEISQDNGASYYKTGDRFNSEVSFITTPHHAQYKFTLSEAVSPSVEFFIDKEQV